MLIWKKGTYKKHIVIYGFTKDRSSEMKSFSF